MNKKQLLALKPGQKVAVVKSIKEVNSIVGLSREMKDYAGQVFTVKQVGNHSAAGPVVTFEETSSCNNLITTLDGNTVNPRTWIFSPELVRYARKSDIV